MKYRKLGNTNIQLSAIGLGCMGMSHAYGKKNDPESIETLHKALDFGHQLLGHCRCVRKRRKRRTDFAGFGA